MRGLMLLFALHTSRLRSADDGSGDGWFAMDKAKHFFMAAFVQTVSFSAYRAVGLSYRHALVGATVTSSAVGIGKELYDLKTGGDASWRDLTWDGVGIAAASALLTHTEK